MLSLFSASPSLTVGVAPVTAPRAAASMAASSLPFTKYHGLGNDFVLLDCRDMAEPPLTPTQRAHVLKTDIAPCMIRHDPGLYAVHLDRMLTAAECLALQGFAPETVETPQVTPLQMRMLCGNAMHCGVLARVLECLLAE